MECEKHEECNILCNDLDQYEYMEECPDYVKENEDENCKGKEQEYKDWYEKTVIHTVERVLHMLKDGLE